MTATYLTPARSRWHPAPEVLVAAQQWKDLCLLRNGSVFSDNELWSPTVVAHLDRYFVKNLDYGTGDFYEKLQTQLEPAPPAAKQLAAEMLWLLFLFVSSAGMGGATKRQQIRRVWEWSGQPLPESPMLGEALDRGVGRPGTAYNTMRWRELVFLIELTGEWKSLPPSRGTSIANDPWEFGSWIESIPSSKGRQFRHILLYLLFPDSFERIATSSDKKQIVREFRKEFGDSPDFLYRSELDLDREVARVREQLQRQESRADFDFYREPIRSRWERVRAAPLEAAAPNRDTAATDQWFRGKFGAARVWAIGTGEGGRLWTEFQRDGIVAVSFKGLGDLTGFAAQGEIRKTLAEEYGRDPINDSLAAWQFAHEIRVGDWVLAKKGLRELFGLGRITSDYRYSPEKAEYQHVRQVAWEMTGHWRMDEDFSMAAKTLTEISDYREVLRKAVSRMEKLTSFEDPPSEDQRPPSPFSQDDALQDVFMPPAVFSRALDALARKKAVVLEGPPGVGKTFVARRLAYAFLKERDPQRVEMVQFHQSYAYEDFIQGWRPTASGGFELRPGVFYRFCERARNNRSQNFVFVIDEMNRANLSKVFGEVMMLIEADKRGDDFAIPLTYSAAGERFSVPENVHVIGLMNTADRSLAFVDYALRRRFSFVRVEPAFSSDAFSEALQRRGVEAALVGRIVDRMQVLNHAIREDSARLGPGFEIGHSFFVPPADAESLGDDWLGGVLNDEIEPLLREYWFDDPDRVEQEMSRLRS